MRRRYPSVDTDDVLQEAYLKLLRSRAVFRLETAKAYFFTVARNTARTVFRRQRIYSDVPVSELPPWRVIDGTIDAATAHDGRQRLLLVAEAIHSLPRRCREIMELAVADGLSSPEIARRLALSEATVRVQLARGVRRCTDYLRQKGELS